MPQPPAYRALRLVVIGFGPVAARLVDELRPAVRDHRLQILVVGAEPSPAYNRILLGELALERIDPELLIMTDATDLAEDGVQLRLGLPVTDIDRQRRYVTLADGDQYAYDLLVFATGAAARVPALSGLPRCEPGEDSALPDGVTVLRDLSDARRLATMAATGRGLIVLGGGVLGMELALSVAETGTAVSLVHTGPVPMERNLDPTAAAIVSRHLRRHQVRDIANARAAGVRLEDRHFAELVLADGTTVAGDGLVLCCGAVPRTGLAARAGLGTETGILVDHDLRSVDDHAIYAIGDCARVRCDDRECQRCLAVSAPSGLIAPGLAQAGWLAGQILAGLDRRRSPEASPDGGGAVVILKVPGLSVVSAGTIDLDPLDCLSDVGEERRVAQWSDPDLGRYAKMITRGGILEGLICVGLPRTAAELTLLYERGAELPHDRSVLLRHDGPDHATGITAVDQDSTICRCNAVSVETINAAIADGHHDVAAIGRATRAGTGCGTCKDRICDLLKEQCDAVVA